MSEFGGLRKHEKHAVYNWLALGNATLLQLAFLGESDLTFPWLGYASLLQMAFLGESDVTFPWEKFPIGTTKYIIIIFKKFGWDVVVQPNPGFQLTKLWESKDSLADLDAVVAIVHGAGQAALLAVLL